jgi:hypothetical protein
MMRTIKYRTWVKDEKMWADHNEQLSEVEVSASVREPSVLSIGSERYELCMFTGLTDKNGVEIYEGDYFRNTETGSVFAVYYGENSACYRAVRKDGWHFDLQQLYPIDNWEVIGNIYEEVSE